MKQLMRSMAVMQGIGIYLMFCNYIGDFVLPSSWIYTWWSIGVFFVASIPLIIIIYAGACWLAENHNKDI